MTAHANPRLQAVALLTQVLPAKGAGISLRAALGPATTGLSAADRGLVYDLGFGVCRHYRLLNSWLDQHMQTPLKASAQSLRLALCCGLYELWFSQRPAHAIVNAWPDICRQLRQVWAVKLTNALLRKASRDDINAWCAQQSSAIRASLPDWLYSQWQQDWPDQIDTIASACLSAPPLTLRINPLRQSRAAYKQRLQELGIGNRIGGISEYSLYLQDAVPVERLPGFAEGECSVQDEAAQLPASLIDAPATGRILDACAAPGGKTGQLCERFPEAQIHALEIDAVRLSRVSANLQRLRLEARLIEGDASQPQGWWDGQPYDAILLDAPCSATGILRRQPDGKWHKQAADIAQLAKLQRQLLTALWPLLKSGGCLVYATCSISQQENSHQIRAFLVDHMDACDTTPALTIGAGNGPGCQLLPSADGWDGFYFARLQKLPA